MLSSTKFLSGLFLLSLVFFSHRTAAQENSSAPKPIYRKIPEATRTLINEAGTLYNNKEYEKAADKFAEIIRTDGQQAPFSFYHDEACCRAQIGQKDSAIKLLQYIADRGYDLYGSIMSYPELMPLHEHPSWIPLTEKVSANRFKKMKNPDVELIRKLDAVIISDQANRWELMDLNEKKMTKSPEFKVLLQKMKTSDSLNLFVVRDILDTHGWPSNESVGKEAFTAMFLVIQHAPSDVQEHYLPMMRDAVKEGKLERSHVGYIEDRIAVDKGQEQHYGSQVGTYENSEEYFVYPISDISNLDKRRAEMGMESMSQYMAMFKIPWSAEWYQNQLPRVKREIGKKK